MTTSTIPRWANAVALDVFGLRTFIVNLYFIGIPGPGNPWVLVDAGLANSVAAIKDAAEELYGPNNPPRSILLTHAHFDHVGALPRLLEQWNVPVYAHEKELPYLTSKVLYPPADPSVDPGWTAKLSPLYPRGSAHIPGRVQALPEDGSVPGLPDWRWLATPGHSPGHVSFFRDSDRVLLAGDAFVTTRQESAFSALTQQPEHVFRPPAYFTINWVEARHSVEALAELEPLSAGTGHGRPMHGEALVRELHELADNFPQIGIPFSGYYAHHPVEVDKDGNAYTLLPPDPLPKFLAKAGVAVGAVALALVLRRRGRGAN